MNSAGGKPQIAGAVAFGGHNNAAPAQFEEDDWVQLTDKGRKMVADGMAHSIVRLQRELDEANARIALLEEERSILLRERANWKAKFIQANKDYGFELMDPCGTIWDHAKRLQQERDEAREDAKRATYDAAQETIKVSTVKSHWIEACRERDEARGVLPKFRQKLLDQAATFKREDLRDNSRWSIFNEGRAQALEKMANELEGTK